MQDSGEPATQSNSIVAVIFDYGQVLSMPPCSEELDAVAHRFAVSLERFTDTYFPCRAPYDRGDWSNERFWLELARMFDTTLSGTQISELIEIDYRLWTRPNSITLNWVNKVREAGYKTGLLSNMPIDHQQYIAANCHWMPQFDHCTYSGEIGCIKPEPEIFLHCLKGLNVDPPQALFIDDNAANVLAARELRMHAICFTNVQEAALEFSALTGFELPIKEGVAQ